VPTGSQVVSDIPASEPEAARFLAQAAFGATRTEVQALRSMGYRAWLEDQFERPRGQSHYDWLLAQGYGAETYRYDSRPLDATIWRKLLAGPDPLRQRVTFALSQLLVVSVNGVTSDWPQFAVAHYLDILEAHAFGNYRALLRAVTLSTAMGQYLTYRGNRKASTSGSVPDENYARELMQLFTIGLVQLRPDGTPEPGGAETYGQADVTGLARVFTGWDFDRSGTTSPWPPEVHRRPMAQVASRYETGAKTFLGRTIAAGTPALQALDAALDVLFQHPNTAPFVGRQLIQRLVTSNPSAGYVARVAAAFADNGLGVRGDLRAVVAAILLDPEARDPGAVRDPRWGKLREPVARLVQWGRTFGAASPSGEWAVGDLSNPGSALGQSPMRSPSVFNFYRPGYVPPGTAIAGAGLTAPEFQITTESSVAGYVNYMQSVIAGQRIGDVRCNYAGLLALAGNTRALLDELNLLLAAGQLATGTQATIKTALDAMPVSTDAQRLNRVMAAVLLVLASPDYLVQK
jgi:uncharacterized protein (DUF1800 family)